MVAISSYCKHRLLIKRLLACCLGSAHIYGVNMVGRYRMQYFGMWLISKTTHLDLSLL